RSTQTSTTRSWRASRPVISRSTKANGASPTGKSQGGPGGGGGRFMRARRGARCLAPRRCRARPSPDGPWRPSSRGGASRGRGSPPPTGLGGGHGGEERPGAGAAARADGVAEGDAAPVDVHAGEVELEAAHAGNRLGGEGLVQLDEIQVFDRPAGAGERLAAR